MQKFFYIITNISMPDICKVGITGDIEKRLRSLNKTGLPTRFQIYETLHLAYPEFMEQKILQHFSEYRINRKREFIKIHPERICDYIIDNKNLTPENEYDVSSKFQQIGLNTGDVLKFQEGENIYHDIIATVGAGNSIFYLGRKSSFSKSAKKILKEKFDKDWRAVQGTLFWTYQGKTIRELMDEKNI